MKSDGWIRKSEIYIYLCITCMYAYVCVYIYVCVCRGILSSLNEEGNPAICDNMDEPWTLYKVKSNKEKYVWSHLYAEAKKTHKEPQKNREYYSECQGGGGNAEMLVKRSKCPVIRWISSRGLM